MCVLAESFQGLGCNESLTGSYGRIGVRSDRESTRSTKECILWSPHRGGGGSVCDEAVWPFTDGGEVQRVGVARCVHRLCHDYSSDADDGDCTSACRYANAIPVHTDISLIRGQVRRPSYPSSIRRSDGWAGTSSLSSSSHQHLRYRLRLLRTTFKDDTHYTGYHHPRPQLLQLTQLHRMIRPELSASCRKKIC